MLSLTSHSPKRENFCSMWALIGLYLFLSSFFWASGPAPLRVIFYLFLLTPFLLALCLRKFSIDEYGGWFTISALTYAGYTVFASLWGDPADFGFYLKQWIFLAVWLAGIAWLFQYRKLDIQRMLAIVIAIGTVAAIATLGFFYVYQQHPLATRMMGLGLAENPTIVAQNFGVVAVLAYTFSLQSLSWKKSLVCFLATIVCVLPILMSQSRGAALALIMIFLAALVIVRPLAKIWVPQVLVAGLAAFTLFFFTNMEEVFRHRGISFSLRDIIWAELFLRILERPFFGVGLEHDARIIIPDVDVFHHAHNSWIDILYYTGLCGLLLAVWHWALLLRTFSRHRDILPIYLWLAYGCLCLFTNGSGLLTRPDAQWWVYWVPAGILAALVMSQPRWQKK